MAVMPPEIMAVKPAVKPEVAVMPISVVVPECRMLPEMAMSVLVMAPIGAGAARKTDHKQSHRKHCHHK
jgi:hypothetical protein